MLLENKVAVITGAARGIGLAIAKKFSENGAKIAITDIAFGDETEEFIKDYTAKGGKVKTYKADASSFEGSQKVIDEILADFGRIDVLVNNAGITRDTLLMRMTEEQWDLVINVNLKSVFNMTKAVQKTMLKQREGSIVNISSVVGVGGNAGQANYSASKAGIIGFTNTGTGPLEKPTIETDCNCIQVRLKKEKINPGENGSFAYLIGTTKLKKGVYSQIITIKYNGKTTVIQLIFKVI